jgi:hypothetical protein
MRLPAHVLRVWSFDAWSTALGVLGLASACQLVDRDHCAYRADASGRTADAWCMVEHGLPHCDRCRPSTERGGCSTERPAPEECISASPEAPASDTGTSEGGSSTGPLSCEPDGFHAQCAELDPLAPFCIDGGCAPCDDRVCPDGACDPRPAAECVACRPDAEAACPEQAPWCGNDLVCTDACTRHAQCPDSACDLAAGTCLPSEGGLAWVDGDLERVDVPTRPAQCRASPGADWRIPPTYCDLATALADAPNPAVIRLRAAEHVEDGPWWIEEQRTVVVMAAPSEGSVPVRSASTADPYLFHTSPSSRLYLEGLVAQGPGDLGSTVGFECLGATGQVTELWLDDVEAQRFETGVRTDGCDVHLRRSAIHDNEDVGVDVTGRSVTLESSVVARNGGVGVRATGTTVKLRFASLLGNDAAGGPNDTLNLECVGTTMGSAEGSLVLEPRGVSILCGNEAFFLDRTLTDDELAGRYRELDELFSDLTRGRLRAPETNPIAEGGLVPWELRDPYFDLDGEPRPRTDRPLVFPGADEP